MDVDYSKSFLKQFENLHKKLQVQSKKAIQQFQNNSETKSLRNHTLKGEWLGYRSITAGGDLRLHYRVTDENRALFVAVGSHSQLYK